MIGRCLRLGISACVLAGDELRSGIAALAGKKLPGTYVVINYHSFDDDVKEQFAAQMRLLLRLATPVSAIKSQEVPPGTRYVAVTVDDAFRSFVRNAWPVLKELKIPVVLFVPTGYLGRSSAWVDYGGENRVGEDVIDAKTLAELGSEPLIDVGSHSATHADLVLLNDDGVRQELCASRDALQLHLGRSIESLSFPYGSFGERELRIAAETGYRYQFSVSPSRSLATVKQGLVGRVSAQPRDWMIEFRLKVHGAYRWMETASVWKRRLRSFVKR